MEYLECTMNTRVCNFGHWKMHFLSTTLHVRVTLKWQYFLGKCQAYSSKIKCQIRLFLCAFQIVHILPVEYICGYSVLQHQSSFEQLDIVIKKCNKNKQVWFAADRYICVDIIYHNCAFHVGLSSDNFKYQHKQSPRCWEISLLLYVVYLRYNPTLLPISGL